MTPPDPLKPDGGADSTRATLLERVRNVHDDESWQEFFDTYWKLIYAVALKMGLNETEAQEAVQETIIAVSKTIPEFKYDPDIGSFRSWLLTQARWKVHDLLRVRQKAAARFSAAPEATGTGTATIDRIPDPQETGAIWEAEWRQKMMELALERVKRRVNPRHYQIFDFYVLQGMAASQVQQTLRVNIAQIYLAKSRVQAELRRQLRQLRTHPE